MLAALNPMLRLQCYIQLHTNAPLLIEKPLLVNGSYGIIAHAKHT